MELYHKNGERHKALLAQQRYQQVLSGTTDEFQTTGLAQEVYPPPRPKRSTSPNYSVNDQVSQNGG